MAAPQNATSVPLNPLALLPKIPALDNTFGAVLLGTFAGLILYGLTLHQSYRYFRMYPGDSTLLKGLTFTSVLTVHICYFYLVTNYFDPFALLRGTWSMNIMPLASGIAMTSTQSFFARRVWILGPRYRILVAFAAVLCILEIGKYLTPAATAEAFIIPTFEGFEHVTWLVSTGSTMAVTADILLTVVLIFTLKRSRTGIRRTDSMLDVMIMYSINTGLLTGVFNLLSLLFAFLRPGNLIYIGIGIPGTKMYANTLLAALNSRQSLASKCSGPFIDTSPFGFSTEPAPEPPASTGSLFTPRRINVRHSIDPTVTTESMVLELSATKSGFVRDLSVEDVNEDLERQDKAVDCPSAFA